MAALDLLHSHEREISLVLLDIVMPQMDGFEVLAMMNKYYWIEEIPVIIISSENSHSVVERAYEWALPITSAGPLTRLLSAAGLSIPLCCIPNKAADFHGSESNV